MYKYISLILIMSCFSLLFTETITRTLDNGMRVVVRQTNSNTAGLFCFVETGSIHEGDFLGSGISHYLEHVISGGSTFFRTEAEYAEIEATIGAVTNAFTSWGVTCFHTQVELEFIDIALQILAENIIFCRFDEFEVEREKQVIQSEIIMRSTPPTAQLYQRAREFFHANNHNKYPIIGTGSF